MSLPKDFKVAIIGGGMCGLACAAGLTKAGIHVDVFESTAKFEEVGAGIGLGPNALRALKGLGLLDSLVARQSERAALSSFQFRSGLVDRDFTFDYPCAPEDVGITIHRAMFHAVMLDNLDQSIIQMNKRCVSVSKNSETSKYTIQFIDGTSHEADIVIGADGIKSAVRECVVTTDQQYPVFTGTTAYRNIISREALDAAGFKTHLDRPICFLGTHKHLIIYPIKAGALINVVVFVTGPKVLMSSASSEDSEDLVSQFDGWNSDVQAMIKCMKNPSKWALHELDPPLPTYISGRVALVGDAAHGMLPHLGGGVAQGIEDVYILCDLLSHSETNLSNIEAVIQAYDRVRVPRANDVLMRSRFTGTVFEGLGLRTDEETLAGLTNQWAPLWYRDLEADKGEAIRWLQETGAFSSPT